MTQDVFNTLYGITICFIFNNYVSCYIQFNSCFIFNTSRSTYKYICFEICSKYISLPHGANGTVKF